MDLSPFMPHFSILAGVPQSDQYMKLQGKNGCEFKVHEKRIIYNYGTQLAWRTFKREKEKGISGAQRSEKKRARERGGARSTKSEPLPSIRVFRDMRGERDTQEGEKRVFLRAPRENGEILSSLEKKPYSVGQPRSQDSLLLALT